MVSVKELYAFLAAIAPLELKMQGDNVGLLVGREHTEVERILVALDITEEVIAEAVEKQCGLLVAHHPVIFGSVSEITDRDPTGRLLLSLIEHRMAAICMHTNLDVAPGGVNDVLAQNIGLERTVVLADGICRAGFLNRPQDLRTFCGGLRETLCASGLRYYDSGRPVLHVAVGGGSCGEFLPSVLESGCDTFVTADIKHHQWLLAKSLKLNLIDAGHFSTEDVVCPVLVEALRARYPELWVQKSETLREIAIYLN